VCVCVCVCERERERDRERERFSEMFNAKNQDIDIVMGEVKGRESLKMCKRLTVVSLEIIKSRERERERESFE
jgi:hypothetical protein